MFTLSKKLNNPASIFLLIFFILSCNTESKEEKRSSKIFPGFNYTKAIAYDYDGSEKGDLIIEKGKLHPSVKKEFTLSKEQTEALLVALNDTLSYGADYSRCFKPHMGIVFYDENDKPKAQISICFLCNQHNSFPLISAQEKVRNSHPEKLHGYSDKGRKALINLCRSLNFSNCISLEK
jgi:hypothetical protein